jgi:hypothetical protein
MKDLLTHLTVAAAGGIGGAAAARLAIQVWTNRLEHHCAGLRGLLERQRAEFK